MGIVKESELRIIGKSTTDFVEPKRMQEVIVVQERDNGAPGGSNTVAGHGPQTLLPRKNPGSVTFPHITLKLIVVEVGGHNDFNRRPYSKSCGGEGLAEKLPPTPRRDDDRNGLPTTLASSWIRFGYPRTWLVVAHGPTFLALNKVLSPSSRHGNRLAR
jgi:hypothetical protein